MKYRKLGKTGLVLSEITYGSWLTFGNQVEFDQAKAIIEKAFELGINTFDCADVYKKGEAELLLGKVLAKVPRSQFVVTSKAFWPMSDAPTDRGLSRKHLFDSVNASLERLNMQYIDIFYCHRFDPETPLSETCSAFNDLIRMGKIMYWGTSEWEADQIKEAHALCVEKGWEPPVVNQPCFNLLTRKIESEILPTCVELGMGTCNFSPLAQGLLSGKYSGGKVPEGSRGGDSRLNMWMKESIADSDLLQRIDKIEKIAKKYSLSLSQVALAWILQHEGISSVIVGASKPQQLEENVGAVGVSLDSADMEQLDQWFPKSNQSFE